MTSRSKFADLTPRERGNYGFARARDLAFDAIQTLWRRRRSEGMKQTDIVTAIGRQPAWVSRNLNAPGNWTLRTIGELVEALGGELEIAVHAREDEAEELRNYSAYTGYETMERNHPPSALEGGSQIIGQPPPAAVSGGQVAS